MGRSMPWTLLAVVGATTVSAGACSSGDAGDRGDGIRDVQPEVDGSDAEGTDGESWSDVITDSSDAGDADNDASSIDAPADAEDGAVGDDGGEEGPPDAAFEDGGDSDGGGCESIGTECTGTDLIFRVPCPAESDVWQPDCRDLLCACGYFAFYPDWWCDALSCAAPTSDWGDLCLESERAGATRVLCVVGSPGSSVTRVGCCQRDGYVRCDIAGAEGTIWCPG